jgi:hypothetical protein
VILIAVFGVPAAAGVPGVPDGRALAELDALEAADGALLDAALAAADGAVLAPPAVLAEAAALAAVDGRALVLAAADGAVEAAGATVAVASAPQALRTSMTAVRSEMSANGRRTFLSGSVACTRLVEIIPDVSLLAVPYPRRTVPPPAGTSAYERHPIVPTRHHKGTWAK